MASETRTTVVASAQVFETALTDVGITRAWEVVDWLGDPAVQIEATAAQLAQLMATLVGAVGLNDALLIGSFTRLDPYRVSPHERGLRYWYFPGLELF